MDVQERRRQVQLYRGRFPLRGAGVLGGSQRIVSSTSRSTTYASTSRLVRCVRFTLPLPARRQAPVQLVRQAWRR